MERLQEEERMFHEAGDVKLQKEFGKFERGRSDPVKCP